MVTSECEVKLSRPILISPDCAKKHTSVDLKYFLGGSDNFVCVCVCYSLQPFKLLTAIPPKKNP